MANSTITPRKIEERETVAGQMKGLLEEESPYITMSRTKAAETAQKRGLLSSTMAVQAGEAAAIESVLPVAQQAAETYATAGLSAQESAQREREDIAKGQITKELAAQEYGLRGALSAQEATQVRTLSTQEATQAQALAAKQHTFQTAEIALKSEWDMKIRTMMEQNAFDVANMQDFGQTTRTQLDNALNQYIKEIGISSDDKQSLLGAVDGAAQQYQVALTNISTSDLSSTAKADAIQNALDAYRSTVTTAASISGMDISWDGTETTSALSEGSEVDQDDQSDVDLRNMLATVGLDQGSGGWPSGLLRRAEERQDTQTVPVVDTPTASITPSSGGTKALVAQTYQNVFGRGADPEGAAYWKAQIEDPNSPVTAENLEVAVRNAAKFG